MLAKGGEHSRYIWFHENGSFSRLSFNEHIFRNEYNYKSCLNSVFFKKIYLYFKAQNSNANMFRNYKLDKYIREKGKKHMEQFVYVHFNCHYIQNISFITWHKHYGRSYIV